MAVLNEKEEIITEPLEIANNFNTFFCSQCKTNHGEKQYVVSSRICMCSTEKNKVRSIKQLKNLVASGIDEISPKILNSRKLLR